MNTPAQILIIDDSKLFWLYLRKSLEISGIQAEITKSPDIASGIEQLKQRSFDCIILDYILPDGNGLLILQERKVLNITTPVVVLTGQGDEQVAVNLMKAGAADYISKSSLSPERLGQSIKNVMYSYRMEKQHIESEKRLRYSEEQYRSIFEASQDVIYITTKEGSFLNINRAGFDLFGYSWDELQNLHVEAIYAHPPDRQRLIGDLERNSFVKDYSIILKKKDGSSIYALITANIRKNVNGQIVLQGIIRDITKSKLADEDLREAHAQINHLLGSISSILIGTSFNDRINQWNLAAENCFGISSGEAVGKHLSECGIKWDWSEVQKQLAICKSSNMTIQLENLHYTAIDGRDGLLRLHINPIVDAYGKYWGYVFLGRDITEQKKIESQLMLSQKMESIGQLAAGIAHEINTPMQYIGDNTRFLYDSFRGILAAVKKYESIMIDEKSHVFTPSFNELKDIAQELDIEYLKEEIPKSIEQSLEGIKRVSKLILVMKEFSHPGKQGKTFSDLNKAIEGTVIISKNEWKYVADLETQLDLNLPLVYCEIDQINQVVLNMIVNSSQAIKDLVDNGTISKGKIKIQTEYKEPIVRITISDTGKGIPRSIIHKVFDHFFTTKEVGKGTGQGLTIAHDIIVNKHHGSIEVNSVEGKGATFVVTLPVNTDECGSDL